MKRKRAFTLIMLIPAIVLILWGIPITNNYTHQTTDQATVFSSSVVVPANKTAYMKLEATGPSHAYWEAISVSNGTIEERAVSPDNLSNWTNTSQFKWYPASALDMLPISSFPVNYYTVFGILIQQLKKKSLSKYTTKQHEQCTIIRLYNLELHLLLWAQPSALLQP